jgi:hypothetical protein
MVCITKCLGLLICGIRIDRIVVFTISSVRLCGLVNLMIWGSMVRAARWFIRCGIAWFALEGHNVIGVNCLGGWARSASRSTCSRDFGNEGVERHHRNLGLGC